MTSFPSSPFLAEKTVYITDGAMNVSGAADLFANQRAREIAPVRLNRKLWPGSSQEVQLHSGPNC